MFSKKFFTSVVSFSKKLKRLDFLIILIVFAIFSSLIISKLIKKEEWVRVGLFISNEEWWWQTEKQTSYWLINDLAIGDVAKNTFGETIAEVVDKQTFEDGEGRSTIFVVLDVRSYFDNKRGLYLFNSEPIEVGRSLNLTFGKNNVDGVISFIGDKLISDQVDLAVLVKVKWVDLDVAAKLEKGMIMSDEQGRILAEVMDFTSEIHSNYEFSDIRGENIKVIDPDYRDLTINLRLKAYKNADNYYLLDGTKLGIGSDIKVYLNSFSIGGDQAKIIDFKEI
ncbi:MAG: hypothetical protein ACOZAK_04385 [Patescibacteria group bacterium]